MADNKNVILFGVLAAGAVFLLTRRASATAAQEVDTSDSPPSSTQPPSGTKPPTPTPPRDSTSTSGGRPSGEEMVAIRGAQGVLNEFRESVDLGFTDLPSSPRNLLLSTFSAPLALDGNAGALTYAAARAFAVATEQALDLFTPPGLRGVVGWENVSDAVNDWLDEHERAAATPVTGDERVQLQRRIQSALNRLRNTPAGTTTTYLEWFNRVKADPSRGITYSWEDLSVDGVVGSRTNAAYNAFRLGVTLAAAEGGLLPSRRPAASRAIGWIPSDITASLSATMQLPTGNRAALTTIADGLEQLAGTARA